MKKRLLLLMTCLMLGLFGCREDDTRESEEAELDAVSSSMDGTLTEYTGSELSIEAEDGGTLSFKDCSSAKIQCKNGINP